MQRTEGVQKERLGDRVPEASSATPQKQTQMDATTDGAEEVTATEAELLAERELQEQTKESPDRDVYAGAAARRQLAMLEAATEEAEQRQNRKSDYDAVIRRLVAQHNYAGAARVQAQRREEYATEETERAEQRQKHGQKRTNGPHPRARFNSHVNEQEQKKKTTN